MVPATLPPPPPPGGGGGGGGCTFRANLIYYLFIYLSAFSLFAYIVFNYVYFTYKKVIYFVYNDSDIKAKKTRLEINPGGERINYIIFTCVACGIAPCQIVRILLRQ